MNSESDKETEEIEGDDKPGKVAVYNTAITVVIVDDHELMRKVIRDILARDEEIKVRGAAASSEEALPLIADERPDVVIVDLAMPGVNGIELTKEIRSHDIKKPVLLLSVHSWRHLVREANQAGAQGYLNKQSMTRELIPAVHALSEGQQYYLDQ